MVELVEIGSPGPLCSTCQHYQELESKVAGFHRCRSYPKILQDIIDGTYQCPVGPVVARRRLTSPVPAVPAAAPALEAEAPEGQGYHQRVAAEQESVDAGPRRPGRPRKSAGK